MCIVQGSLNDMLMQWISSTDFPAQQSDLINRKQEGTGSWFLTAPEFFEWQTGSKKTLFCPGMPGAGKTMMAAIVIDHLQKTVQSDTVGVAYIYCNYKSQTHQNANNLLAAILKQLVQARPSVMEPVSNLYYEYSHSMTKPSLEETLSALYAVIDSYSTVFIVIDALDECSAHDGFRTQLLAKIRELQRDADLRIMVTSRLVGEIENYFWQALILEIRANDLDVERFVEGKIGQLPECIREDGELQRSVKTTIVQAVNGM